MRSIDINCDLGESFGAWVMGDDQAILPWISSANVACGFHAGDPTVMDSTVKTAAALGVEIGAHPGFPDLVGFGRRALDVTYHQAVADVTYQMGALMAFCHRHGVALQHVKPHGELNNRAIRDPRLADAIVDAIYGVDHNVILISYGGALELAAKRRGLVVAKEVFADRAYHRDGSLVSRREEGAVLKDPDLVAKRVIDMVVNQRILSVEGDELEVSPDTICVHGDTPGASALIRQIRDALDRAGVTVKPLRELLEVGRGLGH